jgi:hypothetical protein
MMAKSAPSTIVLEGDPSYEEYPLAPLDACGNGSITPGMLVETVNGEVRPHSTQGGNADRLFAVEGLNIDPDSKTMGDIDVDYDDDNGAVKVARCKGGELIYALLGAGQSVSIDGLLQSASDGYLMAYATPTNLPLRPVARATETVNNAAGTSPARIKVRVF